MFGLFKRKKPPVSEELRNFQNSFTENQKATVIASLIVIANSHEHMSHKKANNIVQTATLLGINPNSPMTRKLYEGGKDELIQILNTLDESQKEWYIIAIHELATTDGVPRDKEINYVLGFADSIGITEESYEQIIEHAALVIKKLYNA